MKNLEQIREKIESLLHDAKSEDLSVRDRKAIATKLEFNRAVVHYLETEPTEAFVKAERDRLENFIDLAEESWKTEYTKFAYTYDRMVVSTVNKRKREYLKELNLPDVNKQLKNLIYILS
jgi:5-bromo-4-chloroindolyl phosphate hydrolysis protein